MNDLYSHRIHNVKKSVIREIFKYLETPGMISFSGGFPNPESFPIDEVEKAASKVLKEDGQKVLQYSGTEGYLPLRQWICDRYFQKHGMVVEPKEVLIVNGSQQAFDLISKVFLNEGDHVLLEKPAYLGAIQSFQMYEPIFHTATLGATGIEMDEVKQAFKAFPIKLFYTVPNFQNPSGITYGLKSRQDVAAFVKTQNVVFVEDDPYGELRFFGESHPPIKKFIGEDAILLGSFSKVIAPGLRLGWVVAKPEVMEKLVVAKQASDLHSNYLSQRLIYEYVTHNDLDAQIDKIKEMYRLRREVMVKAMQTYFPKEVSFTQPEGGMFLWVTLPKGMDAMKLFDLAVKEKVVFVPGDPFFPESGGTNTMRLNYTNSDPKEIEEGIQRLAKAIQSMM